MSGSPQQGIETLGVQRLHDLARKIAAEVAPEKFEARTRRARSGRRVTVRRSSEPGMADLTAHLPVEQAVACYAALRKAVNEVWVKPEPVLRGQGQIMADTLVERLTGQATAEDVDIAVHIMVPVEALLDPTARSRRRSPAMARSRSTCWPPVRVARRGGG